MDNVIRFEFLVSEYVHEASRFEQSRLWADAIAGQDLLHPSPRLAQFCGLPKPKPSSPSLLLAIAVDWQSHGVLPFLQGWDAVKPDAPLVPVPRALVGTPFAGGHHYGTRVEAGRLSVLAPASSTGRRQGVWVSPVIDLGKLTSVVRVKLLGLAGRREDVQVLVRGAKPGTATIFGAVWREVTAGAESTVISPPYHRAQIQILLDRHMNKVSPSISGFEVQYVEPPSQPPERGPGWMGSKSSAGK